MSDIDSSTPQIGVRGDGDLPACVTVLRAVHLSDGYPVNWPDDPARWLGGGADEPSWVAHRGGRVVGHVTLTRPGAGDVAPTLVASGTGVAVVGRLFVDPSARGHRIGTLLIETAVREARLRGARAVLDVAATDRAAVALYERLGWEFLGTRQQEWQPGQLVDVRCYAAPAPGGGPEHTASSQPTVKESP
ncbi:GNAT family N-acetyltransferase [Streptomyces sp. cg35]|uniref:GNAT family N-acetyltransferase n=1 Tax=Streptomyces sp. cg35 TaxID=3421650 RepID=UPI003D180060